MIGWLLRTLGVHDDRPEAVVVRFPATEAELRYECARQATEHTIERAESETDLSRQRLVSWEDLFDDPRWRKP